MNSKRRNLKRSLKMLFSSRIHPIIFSDNEPLWHPPRNGAIRSRLQGEHQSDSLYSFLRLSEKHGVLKFYKNTKQNLSTPSMNPQKDYPPLVYWIKPDDLLDFFDSQIFNFLDEDATHIFHYGEKGCGKTLSQNCWLHTRNNSLENKKVFWVRCDGFKLYKLWFDSAMSTTKPTSLNDYLDMQLIYVFARYYKENSFMLNIFEKLKRERVTFDYMPGKVFSHKEERSVVEYIEKLNTDILSYKGIDPSDGSAMSYSIFILKEAQALRTGIDRARFNYSQLSKALQTFLLKNDYRILKVLDGIDNINLLSTTAIPFYYRMLEEVANFMYKSEPSVIKLTSLRERTMLEVQRMRHTVLSDKLTDQILPLERKHPQLNFVKIAERHGEFNQQGNVHARSRVPDFISFHRFLEIETMKQKNGHALEGCYHNNAATFLHNALELSLIVYYRWLQVGKADDFSADHYAKIFRKRNLFLNGRFYLDSSRPRPDGIKQGLYSFNIFYCEPNSEASNLSRRWQGLCTIRILQTLAGVDKATSEGIITQYISNQFGYTVKQIQNSLSLCKDFGMIDSTMTDESRKNNEILIEISQKGKYIVDELVFSELDVLYTLALDTYLPASYRSLLVIHSNKIKGETQYASSAIISSILFMLFLLYVHAEEMETYNENNKLSLKKHHFKLPFVKHARKLLRRVFQLYDLASDDEKKRIDLFIEDLLDKQKNVVH